VQQGAGERRFNTYRKWLEAFPTSDFLWTHGNGRRMQNFVTIVSGVAAPKIRDFAVPFDVTSMFVFWVLQ